MLVFKAPNVAVGCFSADVLVIVQKAFQMAVCAGHKVDGELHGAVVTRRRYTDECGRHCRDVDLLGGLLVYHDAALTSLHDFVELHL